MYIVLFYLNIVITIGETSSSKMSSYFFLNKFKYLV